MLHDHEGISQQVTLSYELSKKEGIEYLIHDSLREQQAIYYHTYSKSNLLITYLKMEVSAKNKPKSKKHTRIIEFEPANEKQENIQVDNVNIIIMSAYDRVSGKHKENNITVKYYKKD